MPVTKIITKIVAYYRLSKPKKGKNKTETIRDAYGLEDQRREVARLAEQYGAKIIAEFTEIVTGTKRKGKKPHREELDKAIATCRMHRAVLVIGKQDRLARNVAFIANLMEAGVEFICADRPHQSKVETHFRALIDEEEADRISERTQVRDGGCQREGHQTRLVSSRSLDGTRTLARIQEGNGRKFHRSHGACKRTVPLLVSAHL